MNSCTVTVSDRAKALCALNEEHDKLSKSLQQLRAEQLSVYTRICAIVEQQEVLRQTMARIITNNGEPL